MVCYLGLGLGDKWRYIINTLDKLIPIYDKGNFIISLGQDIRYRRDGILSIIREGDLILDLGCGPGTMSMIVKQNFNYLNGIVMYDALKSMLREAKKRISGDNVSIIQGVFEYLPFKNYTFNSVICGFALRDAKDLIMAINEIFRVLKNDGKLLIVDLGKPNNHILRIIIGLYWRFIAPILTFILLGSMGKYYSALYLTYKNLQVNESLKSLLKRLFNKVEFNTRMMGGVVIIIAEK